MSATTPPAHNLAADLIGVVVDTARFSPRSRQTSIGPSEIGHPCARKLAYKVINAPATWQHADPWASIIGTATHAWLASAFAAVNLVLDTPRWLVEQRVYPTPSIPGSCDLYDLHTDTVIDHKVVGPTTLASAKRNGPSAQYEVQSHTYGLGWERQGRTVRDVAMAYWPRSGNLSGLFLWRKPYNRDIALNALTRLSNVSAAAVSLHLDTTPENARLIPATPGDECRFCPYRSTRAGDGGCPDAPTKNAPTEIEGIG